MIVCTAVLVAACAAMPTPAAAARKAAAWVDLDLTTNGGGNRLDVLVRVSTARPRIGCVGTARLRRRKADLSLLRTGPKGGAEWQWAIGDGAPRGRLRIAVRCRFPNRKTRRQTASQIIERGPFPRSEFRHVIKPGTLRKRAWTPVQKQEGSGGNEDLYPYGQCTWYVAKQRPDLPYFAGGDGDAKNWIKSARKHGFPTGERPRVGAVAVFQPGQYGAGHYGHVAYVAAVDGKRMTVREANYQDQPIGNRRPTEWAGAGFIYKLDDDEPRPTPPVPPLTPAAGTATARASHTATRLGDGRVLLAGGRSDGVTVSPTAELYDPASNTWAPAASMTSARIFHTATLLQDGKVLVAGGQSALGGGALAGAELYDPASGTWAPAASMSSARMSHTATLLDNGKVLVAGGQSTMGGGALAGAELYDPASDTWALVASMGSARTFHTAAIMTDHTVLVTGGSPGDGAPGIAAAELFDPAKNTWSSAPSMHVPRVHHTATFVTNLGVVVSGGGLISGGRAYSQAEVYDLRYDPIKWVRLPSMTIARMFHTATLLDGGKVLVVGGQPVFGGAPSASGELYDPATNSWRDAGSLGTARVGHMTTLLGSGAALVTGGDPSGRVLVTGGESSVGARATAEAELFSE